MPIYGYRCLECETKFDKTLSIDEMRVVQQCPKCRSIKTIRNYEGTSIGIVAPGCPSYTARRIKENNELYKKTNREIQEDNQAEARKAIEETEVKFER